MIMKYLEIIMLLIITLFTSALFADNGLRVSIIPQPTSVVSGNGVFTYNKQTKIIIGDHSPLLVEIARQCSIQIQYFTKFQSSISTGIPPRNTNTLIFQLTPADSMLGDEGYNLSVDKQQIIIEGATEAGVFYGVQSLLQLLPINKHPHSFEIPAIIIHDTPRFQWRGMHLDVSRHFLPKEFIKTYIDILAMHKMNVFHWHLTDDQGWRIEIKKYPLLTEISAWRVDRESQEWNARDPQREGEPVTYGGFYTQDEIRDIVRYAADRFITIVPEVEMPAHTTAALAAYPQFSCTGGPFTVPPGGVWPITDIYCAGNDSTFIFLRDILTEIMALFPGKYIHIGGDEADKSEWKKCPKCQKRIIAESLRDEGELQSYFIRRIEKFLIEHDRRLIGWDEILEGGLAPEATVMSWRGMDGGIAAARQAHDVVMTPGSYCYLNDYQGKPATEPPAGGGVLTLHRVYSFEPIPPELSADEAKHILGGQGCLWGEYVPTPKHAEYMLLPRLAALAEVFWSPSESRKWVDFVPRIEHLTKRYQTLNYNFAKSIYTVDIQPTLDTANNQIKISLSSEAGSHDIRYTTNGTIPSSSSKKYSTPFSIKKSSNVRAGTFRNDKLLNEISEQSITVHKAFSKPVTYTILYNKYTGGGDYALTNGIRGTKSFDDGNWQGFEQNHIGAIIDLGHEIPIHRVSTSYLQNTSSWIFFPSSIEYSISTDGVHYTPMGSFEQPVAVKHEPVQIKEFPLETTQTKARFIKVTAKNVGTCPGWHAGKGGKAWLFIDEIIVE
jgi:hexosaminidase